MEQVKVAIEKARAARDAAAAERTSAPLTEPEAKHRAAAAKPETKPAAKGDLPPLLAPATSHGTRRDPIARRRAQVAEETVLMNWASLMEGPLNPKRMKQERIVSFNKTHPAHLAFDLTRTRLRELMLQNGWTRVGITSPLPGCGKSVVSANLAFSFARHESCRTILFDLDLKAPSLAKMFTRRLDPRPIRALFSGEVPFDKHLLRYGDNLAVAFNSDRVFDGAELVEDPLTERVIRQIEDQLQPDTEIFDLAPLLSTDDPLAMLKNLDCLILVAGAGHTRPEDVLECERLIAGQTNYLGVLLNKAPPSRKERESYY
jgi:Mrp family chromosome partitioning ATPase